MLKRLARRVVPGPVRRFLQKRTLARQIAAFPRRVVGHDYGGVRLKVELADALAAGWYDHDWAPLPELAVLGRHRLRPGARVFDLGAHQGVVGLLLAARVGPAGRVVLVEANPHNAARCRRNAELNSVTWADVVHAAIAAAAGTMRFNGGLNGAAAEVSDYGGTTEVRAVTVDALAAEYGAPDVVFVDVEGFECRALVGAAGTFAARPDWSVEVHVGCGLEAAGGSVEQVLAHFPAALYDRFVHSEGDAESVRLEDAPAGKLRDRFFLTVVIRGEGA